MFCRNAGRASNTLFRVVVWGAGEGRHWEGCADGVDVCYCQGDHEGSAVLTSLESKNLSLFSFLSPSPERKGPRCCRRHHITSSHLRVSHYSFPPLSSLGKEDTPKITVPKIQLGSNLTKGSRMTSPFRIESPRVQS